jgi:hypothetical protein
LGRDLFFEGVGDNDRRVPGVGANWVDEGVDGCGAAGVIKAAGFKAHTPVAVKGPVRIQRPAQAYLGLELGISLGLVGNTGWIEGRVQAGIERGAAAAPWVRALLDRRPSRVVTMPRPLI